MMEINKARIEPEWVCSMLSSCLGHYDSSMPPGVVLRSRHLSWLWPLHTADKDDHRHCCCQTATLLGKPPNRMQNVQLDETWYYHVENGLDSTTSIHIAPSLPTLPSQHSYTALKRLLLKTHSFSDDQRAHTFLNITELDDRQPSKLMDEILWLQSTEQLNFLLRFAFKCSLPQPVHLAPWS